jgi:nitrile hydratase subunit beta
MTGCAALDPGTRVLVRDDYPAGHIRTPVYVRGREGEITRRIGKFGNPETLAIGRDGLPKKMLYEVKFKQKDLWPDYTGPSDDSLLIDLYEHWLLKVSDD